MNLGSWFVLIAVVILVLVGLVQNFKDWLPESETGVPPAPSPNPLSLLAQIILTYNNQQAFFANGATKYTVEAKGVTVNKIGGAQAQAIATELEAIIPSSDPMSVALALLASESVLDPFCQNGNFAGSNPSQSAWGYDDGIAQLKLCDISVGGKSGAAAFSTATDAQSFAFDVTLAIPYFYGLYNAHLVTADALIAGNTNSAIDPRLMNRYILAAVQYKQGPTGGEAIFQAGVWPAELNNFVSLEGWFAGKLGTASVFAGLTP